MPLSGFEKYNAEMRRFEASKVYTEKYFAFLHYLRQRTSRTKAVTSPVLERNFNIHGALVRKLVNHARRQGEPIASNNAGYFWATTHADILSTINHLEERAREMFFLASRLKKTFAGEQQRMF